MRRRNRVAVLHDGYIPGYRVRLYELLAREGEAEYVVFHGDPPPGAQTIAASAPFGFPQVKVRNSEIGFAGRRLVYQRVVRRVLRGGFDAIVVAAQLRFASSFVLLLAFKLLGKPVVLWGHGRGKAEDVGSLGARVLWLTDRLRTRMARLGDAYLAYTRGGREHLVRNGVARDRVTVLRNTIDVRSQIELHERLERSDPEALRAELGLKRDSVVLLFVGRVYREKRLGELIEAVRAIRDRGLASREIELVVIGDGPGLGEARSLAGGMAGVHFRGAIPDQLKVARNMRASSAVVIPGVVGLAANHAFAQGRPLITREHGLHSPEIEYVEHGVNGLIVPGTLEAFAARLAEFVDDAALQWRLAQGALASRDALSAEAMASAFDEAVGAALASRDRSRALREPILARGR
jgi:glycosyltransferase involved in cell wall biosynthesis